jgi:hypothetical protein
VPSAVENLADTMHQLLWKGMIRNWVEVTMWTIPYVGPFLKIPIIDTIVMTLIEVYLEKPLFVLAARFGLFTSINWGNMAIYRAYEVEAKKLVPLQQKDKWEESDRKVFRDTARDLIRIRLRT